ncbi:hypothetical protein Mapa_007899 [Marchantia paleacea]|nr:hypothetical protein Mapa_007899 [Marchantia paleacea]
MDVEALAKLETFANKCAQHLFTRCDRVETQRLEQLVTALENPEDSKNRRNEIFKTLGRDFQETMTLHFLYICCDLLSYVHLLRSIIICTGNAIKNSIWWKSVVETSNPKTNFK